jgi:hypothetical protein
MDKHGSIHKALEKETNENESESNPPKYKEVLTGGSASEGRAKAAGLEKG